MVSAKMRRVNAILVKALRYTYAETSANPEFQTNYLQVKG